MLTLSDFSAPSYKLPSASTSKFSKAILANDIIKAASLIETQEDRDYVFEHIKITEAKVTSLDRDPRIEVSIAKLGYLWKHIYNPREYTDEEIVSAPALTIFVGGAERLNISYNKIMVDIYLQHAIAWIDKFPTILIPKSFTFILNHIRDVRFAGYRRKYLEACLYEAPNVFYLHISYAPYYDLARKIMGDGVIPPLPGTNPKKIEKNPEEGIVYGNVVVNPDTTITYSNIQQCKTLKEDHPIAMIVEQLKGKLDFDCLTDLATILFYYRNKTTRAIMKRYSINMPPTPSIQLRFSARSVTFNGPFGYQDMDQEHVILCGNVVNSNPDNTYSMMVANTILKGYIDKTSIDYDANTQTVTLV